MCVWIDDSFLSHETAAEPVPAQPTNPQPQTAGDESDRGVNKKQSVGWIYICIWIYIKKFTILLVRIFNELKGKRHIHNY